MSEQVDMTREEWLADQQDLADLQAKALLPIVKAFADNQMTLRQHYAGLAMLGLLSGEYHESTAMQAMIVARNAVEQADYLIAELEKTND